MEIGTKNHRKSEQPNPPWRSEPKTTGNLNNQTHRGDLNNQQPKTTVVAPPDRWDRRYCRGDWTTKNHRKSEERTTKNHRGPCFTAWPRWLQIWAESHAVGLSRWWLLPWRSEQRTTTENLKKEQPKTTVVRASRHGLGGYRSEQRATPWVSPGGGWWFQVEAGCWEKKKKKFGELGFLENFSAGGSGMF